MALLDKLALREASIITRLDAKKANLLELMAEVQQKAARMIDIERNDIPRLEGQLAEIQDFITSEGGTPVPYPPVPQGG